MKNKILAQLSPGHPWGKLLEYHQTIASTNTRAMELAAAGAPEGTVVLAECQTAGRGRMGRFFHSPAASGIYLSLILRPQCHASRLMHLTCAAGVAVCDAIEAAAGFRPGIKWTNDLVLGKKKAGGILTEMHMGSDGQVAYAVVGIGINCAQQEADFPEELRSIATSLSAHAGKKICRSRLAAAMIEKLYKMHGGLLTDKAAVMERYRKNCITLGQEVSVLRGETVFYGKAVDLDEDGGLILQLPNGEKCCVSFGEVSIRGMYGYVN